MAPLPMSRSQIDRLSERLRHSETISDADLDLLLQILRVYQQALEEVHARLRAINLLPTTRTKTTRVLIDKLRREHTSIKSVQDIAGARIVIDGDRDDQDEVVEAIRAEFQKGGRSVKIKDRRMEPSHGYRAVHLVVRVQGLPVEIQVRTVPQDMWAQITEKLGDRWGRGIRYGEAPPEPDKVVVGETWTRQDMWATVRKLSDEIHEVEVSRQASNRLATDIAKALDRGVLTEQQEDEQQAMLADVESLKQSRGEAEDNLKETLETFDWWAREVAE